MNRCCSVISAVRHPEVAGNAGGPVIFSPPGALRNFHSSHRGLRVRPAVAVENCANPFKATPARVPRSVIGRRGVSNTTGR